MSPETAMTSLGQAFLGEFEQELQTTRTVLSRIPEDKLTWKPHAKSMTAGQLGLHIAGVPAAFAQALAITDFPVPETFENQQPDSKPEILDTLEGAADAVRAQLKSMSDADFAKPWNAVKGDTPIFTLPKVAVARSFLLNHWYHHRGEMMVYLRMLDVPLPSVYGPTADENPFA